MAEVSAFNLNNFLPDETYDFPGQTKKAFCWAYYLFSPHTEVAKCRDCGTTIKCKNGGTKSCNDHLKHIHGIVDVDNLKRMNELDEVVTQKRLKAVDLDHMLQQEYSQPENDDEEYTFNTSSVVIAENKQFFSEFIEERNGISSNHLSSNHDEQVRANREDTDRTYMKLDWSFKECLSKKLIEFNETLLNDSIGHQAKLNLLKDNNRLLLSLNSLPVMIDERHSEKHLIDKVKREVKKDVLDILKENESARSHAESAEPKNSQQSSVIGPTNRTAERFARQVEYLLEKVKKFDAKGENIVSWFEKFEMYSRVIDWTDEQRVDGLVHLLDHGLNLVVATCKKEKRTKFGEIKEHLINLVNQLLSKYNVHLHHDLVKLLKLLEDYKFPNSEKSYWFSCYLPASKIQEFYVTLDKSRYYDNEFQEINSFFRTKLLPLLSE